MPKPVYVKSGPFKIEKIDNDCPTYLKIKFSDIRSAEEQTDYISANKILKEKEVLWVLSNSQEIYRYIEYTEVAKNFKDWDLATFEDLLHEEFEASWVAQKARTVVKERFDIRRIRIGQSKDGNRLSKRQGYRVTVFEAYQDINEAIKLSWMIVLLVDEKLDDEDSNQFPEKAEMIKKAELLVVGRRTPEQIHQIFKDFQIRERLKKQKRNETKDGQIKLEAISG